LLRIFSSLLGILLGLILIAACLGIAYMSQMMIGVLNDIGQRDFSQASTRIDRYAARFDAMAKAGFKVQRSEPKILEGKTSYLWVITPPGSDDRLVYRWKHYLSTNTIEPLTNPALLLDIALGYEKTSTAREEFASFYNPEDRLALALAQRDFGSISPDQIAERWSSSQLPSGPVLPPRLTPEEARKRSFKTPEQEAADAEAAARKTEVAEKAAPGDSTDVGRQPSPPRQEQGDGTDVGGGGDSGGGGSTPPHDDAIPVG
jgi:hypothetical protein